MPYHLDSSLHIFDCLQIDLLVSHKITGMLIESPQSNFVKRFGLLYGDNDIQYANYGVSNLLYYCYLLLSLSCVDDSQVHHNDHSELD